MLTADALRIPLSNGQRRELAIRFPHAISHDIDDCRFNFPPYGL